MYELETMEAVERVFHKLSIKNRQELKKISKKVKQILEDPYRFKPLKKPMANKWRVHVVDSKVLVYSIDEKRKTVVIEDYDHHDNIYKA